MGGTAMNIVSSCSNFEGENNTETKGCRRSGDTAYLTLFFFNQTAKNVIMLSLSRYAFNNRSSSCFRLDRYSAHRQYQVTDMADYVSGRNYRARFQTDFTA